MLQPKLNLLNFTRHELEEIFVQMGEKSFRASQVIKWIHQMREIDFSKMSNLSLKFRQIAQEKFIISLPQIVSEQTSCDGTRKWLIRFGDNAEVETVFIPEENRGTLCVSSQAGCPLGCTFCATGKLGLQRNLETAEIIGQLWLINQKLAEDSSYQQPCKITNVVLMGMGEPLLNFDNVVKALDLMMDDHAYGLSKYRVTLSTSGVVPQLKKLREVSVVSLAVSLHAPNDELRSKLMPINKKYPLEELVAVCNNYFSDLRRKVTIEYVMLAGINDSTQHAKQLVRLLSKGHYKINLLVFNEFPGTNFRASKLEDIERFRNILLEAGFNTITRKTRGNDIAAACGQLRADKI